MTITTADRVRFIEKSYDHIRQEMIEHIRFRRNTLVSSMLFVAAIYSWLLGNGLDKGPIYNFVAILPIAISLVALAAAESTNAKILRHINFLKLIEAEYEVHGGFVGFERYNKESLNTSYFTKITERKFIRILLLLTSVVSLLMTIGVLWGS